MDGIRSIPNRVASLGLRGFLIRYAAHHRLPVYALHPSTCMRSEPVNGGPQARLISPWPPDSSDIPDSRFTIRVSDPSYSKGSYWTSSQRVGANGNLRTAPRIWGTLRSMPGRVASGARAGTAARGTFVLPHSPRCPVPCTSTHLGRLGPFSPRAITAAIDALPPDTLAIRAFRSFHVCTKGRYLLQGRWLPSCIAPVSSTRARRYKGTTVQRYNGTNRPPR